jgi:hypothetical protein
MNSLVLYYRFIGLWHQLLCEPWFGPLGVLWGGACTCLGFPLAPPLAVRP